MITQPNFTGLAVAFFSAGYMRLAVSKIPWSRSFYKWQLNDLEFELFCLHLESPTLYLCFLEGDEDLSKPSDQKQTLTEEEFQVK